MQADSRLLGVKTVVAVYTCACKGMVFTCIHFGCLRELEVVAQDAVKLEEERRCV